MKGSTLAALGGTTVGVAGAAAIAALVARHARGGLPEHALHRPVDGLVFSEVVPGVSRALLYGDPDRGPYAAFTRMVPGMNHPRHTHPCDISLVVLSGAYLFGTEEGTLRVGAGSFFFLPGGLVHASGSDPVEGALFFEQSQGRFGLDFVD